MSDLVAFLRARLDEDEAVALAAGDDDAGRAWTADDNGYPGAGAQVLDGHGYHIVFDEGGTTIEQAIHIARYDPARVLREVEARRAIIDDHRGCEEWNERAREDRDGERDFCATLRALASLHGDHPDYRQEWSLVTAG